MSYVPTPSEKALRAYLAAVFGDSKLAAAAGSADTIVELESVLGFGAEDEARLGPGTQIVRAVDSVDADASTITLDAAVGEDLAKGSRVAVRPVIYAQQAAPQEPVEYVTVEVLTEVPIGSSESEIEDNEVDGAFHETIKDEYRGTANLQFIGPRFMDMYRAALAFRRSPRHYEVLKSMGLSITGELGMTNTSDVAGTGYDRRCSVDISFAYGMEYTSTEPADVIESVTATGDLQDGNTIVAEAD